MTCNIKLPTDYLAAYWTYCHVSAAQVLSDETGDVTVSSNGYARPQAINSQHENTYVSMTQCDFYPVPSKNLSLSWSGAARFLKSIDKIMDNIDYVYVVYNYYP